MDFERKIGLDDDTSWFWIGLRIGLGFSVASAVVASITAILWATWIENGVRLTLRDQYRNAPALIVRPTQQQNQMPTQNYAAHGTRHIDSRPSADCLAETGQVLNEQYQRCVKGYNEAY